MPQKFPHRNLILFWVYLWHYARRQAFNSTRRNTMPNQGAFPDHFLDEYRNAGFIKGIPAECVGPDSIDLPLADEIWRIPRTFLPQKNEKVRGLVEKNGIRQKLPMILEKGVIYIIKVDGTFDLPPDIYGYANPKSNAGRVHIMSQTVADGVHLYDHISKGWNGELWVLVTVGSFPIILHPGSSISQMRLFNAPTFLSTFESELIIKKEGLIFNERGRKYSSQTIRRHADSYMLSLDLLSDKPGWVSRDTQEPLDFSEVDAYEEKDFFQEIQVSKDGLELLVGKFYILTTLERIKVPAELTAELRPVDVRAADARTHYAGFLASGWGCKPDGSGEGLPITLEYIPYRNVGMRHGQYIARLRYEHMIEQPTLPYSKRSKSSFTTQNTARLSKHFKT
jgi:dCTP deaminase